jgi:hypothetical protein
VPDYNPFHAVPQQDRIDVRGETGFGSAGKFPVPKRTVGISHDAAFQPGKVTQLIPHGCIQLV